MSPLTRPTPQIILVTGATRSGKSEWAEHCAVSLSKTIVYVATALGDNSDEEWQERIAKHQRRRPSQWQTREIPYDIAEFIANFPADSCLLLDSLGTWVANCLNQDASCWAKTQEQLLKSLQSTKADVILVAEETGWGLVPVYPLGRQFRDRMGDLIRRVGGIADTVYLVTGGYALNLSQLGTPLPPPQL